ncbi:hypothetical protein K1719_042011 [Acacia pycnantha]|nr:hypothetical protein K1719_042011 [Acacia pycnantha]
MNESYSDYHLERKWGSFCKCGRGGGANGIIFVRSRRLQIRPIHLIPLRVPAQMPVEGGPKRFNPLNGLNL